MKNSECPECEDCGLSLATSFYTAGALMKSCTLCSRIAGFHVFHPVEEFGWHIAEDGGLPYLQSECNRITYQRRQLGLACVTTMPLDELRRLLPAAAKGTDCSGALEAGLMHDGEPQTASVPAIADALHPMRQAAARALGVRPILKPAEVSTARFKPAPEPTPAPRPTVFRRRPGQTTMEAV